MTREEAIETLTELKSYHKTQAWAIIGLSRNEALEMAIKALEQQPCEDCISRAEALKHSHIEYDDDGEGHRVIYAEDIEELPPVTPRSLNPEADREESKAYCAECDHIEMCSWYPHDGCEWLKTDRYNAGYNAAKREFALSGEYERAYERGKQDAEQTRWIPVSERLPEEDGFYLATCDGEICGENEPISSMAEFENGKWVDDEDDYQCVLAWMPLPEPYKAERRK